MIVLAITKRLPTTDLKRIAALQVPEARAVWSLMSEGFIRAINFDKDKPAAILTLETPSVAEAERRLASLPMVIEQQIGFDYYVLGPYTQLSHLFAKE